MSLIEYLDRTGKLVSAKTFEKYRDEKHNYSEWEVLYNINKKTCVSSDKISYNSIAVRV